MAQIVDLIEDYIATTNTVIVTTEIKNYSTVNTERDYSVDEDLYRDYPEIRDRLIRTLGVM